MARIGFIGVGNMGGPMTANLLKAGHEVRAFDVVPAALERAVAGGCGKASSAADAVAGAEVVITMLPAGQHVRDVYLGDGGDGGVIAAAKANAAEGGTLLIDSSTIDVASARAVNAAAADAGLELIDAPVSGGVSGAAAGTLTFMVGGSAAAFARAKPYLAIMGGKIVHAGGTGNGQAAKLCNNMMLGVTIVGVCEGFILAEKLGLDPKTLFDISSASSASCWAMLNHCPVPGIVETAASNRDFQPGFSAAMMLKDLKLAQGAASDAGVASPMGAEAAALFSLFVNAGNAGLDYTGIIKMLRGEA